jgi:aspartyl-tRNA(Asn)/glutamyl-tRNA(Gln) amidotransferase subunit B
MQEHGDLNMGTAKVVLNEMLLTGQSPIEIVQARSLTQLSDAGMIADLVQQVLVDHQKELQSYLNGKETLSNWFFGQVMQQARGQGNPQVIQAELERQLLALKEETQ